MKIMRARMTTALHRLVENKPNFSNYTFKKGTRFGVAAKCLRYSDATRGKYLTCSSTGLADGVREKKRGAS